MLPYLTFLAGGEFIVLWAAASMGTQAICSLYCMSNGPPEALLQWTAFILCLKVVHYSASSSVIWSAYFFFFFFAFGPRGLTSLWSVHCLILYVCGCISVKRKLSARVQEGLNAYLEDHSLYCSLCVCTNSLPLQFAITCQTGKHSLLVSKLTMTWLSMGHCATHTVFFSDYIQWICQQDTEKQHSLLNAHTFGMSNMKLNILSRELNIPQIN